MYGLVDEEVHSFLIRVVITNRAFALDKKEPPETRLASLEIAFNLLARDAESLLNRNSASTLKYQKVVTDLMNSLKNLRDEVAKANEGVPKNNSTKRKKVMAR